MFDFDWSVCKDQHGNDHFPIIIESIQTSAEDSNPKWKLNKTDWDPFHSLCDQILTPLSLSESANPVDDFTSSADCSFVLLEVTYSPRGRGGPSANFWNLKVFNISEEI